MADITTENLKPDRRGINRAAEILRAGGRVALPTETVYGLAADARNDHAVAGIFEAKNRPQFNPLIVHLPDVDAAGRLVVMSRKALSLAQAFWPGPLTLVLPWRSGSGISGLVTSGLPTLAVRVPRGTVSEALLTAFGGPLAAPSANPSGRISPTSAKHVAEGLSGRIEAIIDGDPCPVGLESTIIGFDDAMPVMLRPGGLPLEDIEACLGESVNPLAGGTISAPGQLSSHYAPEAALRLNAVSPEPGEAWLGFASGPDAPLEISASLSESGDLREAAANLFDALRRLDRLAKSQSLSRIAVAPIPDIGLGRAINDRLTRAAAPRSGAAALG